MTTGKSIADELRRALRGEAWHGPSLSEAVAGITRLDVLVHSAGVGLLGTVADTSADTWRQQFEVNALGPLRVAAALASKMAPGGKIALLTSRMG